MEKVDEGLPSLVTAVVDCVTTTANSLDSAVMTRHSTDSPDPGKRPVESIAADSPQELPKTSSQAPSNTTRAYRPRGMDEARKLAAAAARVAVENNGKDVIVLDVSDQSAEFDLFVLATGTSRRQLHAISEQIDDVLEKELGDTRLGIEGYDESRWIVLDYGSVIIHLFDDETREYYDLESLWADGKRVPLSDLGIEDAGEAGTTG